MKKISIIFLVVIGILTITNPTQSDYNGYIKAVWGESAPQIQGGRSGYFLVCSIYEDRIHTYLGIFKNFIIIPYHFARFENNEAEEKKEESATDAMYEQAAMQDSANMMADSSRNIDYSMFDEWEQYEVKEKPKFDPNANYEVVEDTPKWKDIESWIPPKDDEIIK